MKESIKKRIEAVRNGQVPEGYGMERVLDKVKRKDPNGLLLHQ